VSMPVSTAAPSDEPILVTGVAGFIGRGVADSLLSSGRRVIGVDNFESPPDLALAEARLETLRNRPGFSFEHVDLADRAAVEELFRNRNPRRVVHLAARAGVRASMDFPHEFTRCNLDAFTNILEGCRNGDIEHLVYASSSSVYGARSIAPFDEDESVDHPVSLYAATKRANELMAHSYAHLYGLPCTGLRFFTVYGPWGRPDMAVFMFTKAIIEGKPITLYEGGALERDFTYVDDIVEGVVRLVDIAPKAGEAGSKPSPARAAAPFRVYNIGNRAPTRVRELVDLLEEAIGKKAVVRALPMPPSDVPLTAAATDAIEATTGFRPETPLKEGVERFVDWYRTFYKV